VKDQLQNQLITANGRRHSKTSVVRFKGGLGKAGNDPVVFRAEFLKPGLPVWGTVEISGSDREKAGRLRVTHWDGHPVDGVYVAPEEHMVDITALIGGSARYTARYGIRGANNGEPILKRLSAQETTITYGDGGRMTKNIRDVNGVGKEETSLNWVHTFEYGRLTSEPPERGLGTVSYSYNSAGLIVMKRIEVKDQKTSYVHIAYDPSMRKASEKRSSSPDPNAPGETIRWEYDHGGRLSKEIDAKGNTIVITYDLDKHTTTWSQNGKPLKIVTTYADGTPRSTEFGDGRKEVMTTEVLPNGTRNEKTEAWAARGMLGSGTSKVFSRHLDWVDRDM
jgi:hypothetical protein